MTLLSALLLLLLMPICSVGPGWVLVRRLRLNSGERLCAAIGSSFIVVYLTATGIYLLNIPWAFSWLFTAVAALLTWNLRQELLSLFRKQAIRRQLGAFVFLILIGLLINGVIRHFSGSVLAGDWLEHYQRSLFFLEYWPKETTFLSLYALPARPPMMNLLAAYFLAHTGSTEFALFQIIFLFLNLLVFFPCVLLAGRLISGGDRRAWPIAAILVLSPFVMQNATYTWTKLFCAFYALLAASLYLRAWQKNDPMRMILAAAMMAGGLLVHYSAGPFAVVIVGHYFFTARKRPRKLMEIGGSVLVGTALLFTWFGWSMAIYGPRTTVASNTSVADAQRLSAVENVSKVGQNLFNTLIPQPLRSGFDDFRYEFDQPNFFGAARDWFYVFYQCNAPVSLGLIGWIALLWITRDALRGAAAPLMRFWLIFVIVGGLLAIAVHGAVEKYGLTPVVLQPLVVIGLTLLAAGLHRLPLMMRRFVLLLLAIDALLGILLQIRIQMHDFRLLPVDAPLMAQTVPFSFSLLNVIATWNSVLRNRMQLEFFADSFALLSPILFTGLVVGIGIAIFVVARSLQVGKAWMLSCLVIFIAGSIMLMSMEGRNSAPTINSNPEHLARLQQAVAANPDSAEAHYELGRYYYDLRQLQPAAAELIEGFLLDPFAIESRYLLRLLLLTHGRFLEETDAWAAEMYRRNLKDPAAIRALANRLEQYHHPAIAARIREADSTP